MKEKALLHYRILGKIGEGGQGTVYKALDTKLGRNVVLKILPPELTAREANLKRFEREAKLASALDHQHICTIFDLHQIEGVHFIVMQYVDGRNVRQLVNGKPLDVRAALLIAIQVADALAAAHARGIIHRDIKPGNVMVTDSGQVKVLDFGLAKLVDETSGHVEGVDQTQLTELGIPYGTATAAAPEQAAGRKVDHRADIFSTGVLLYEMLTGVWPFQGQTTVEVRYAVLHETPKPVAEERGEDSPIIARLQEIVDRALAKNPDDRYQRVEELRDELRAVLREIDPDASQAFQFSSSVPPREQPVTNVWGKLSRHPVIAAAFGIVILLAAAYGAYTLFRPAQDVNINSLAVLPFTNIGDDPSAEYLSDGITESLINSLSQLPTVKVRSRNSVFQYKGRETDLIAIGRDLNVAGVLTGSVEKSGNNVSVNVELIDARDDSHIWGERYMRQISDLPRLQEELSRDITNKLRVRLSGDEQRQVSRAYDTNAESYQLYLQGRFYWNKRTAEGLRIGIDYFSRAIDKDPNYAPAYSGLADCYWLLNVYNVEPATDSRSKAREAATRALSLDETFAEAHASLASISYRYDWQWEEAENHFKRAIQLKPDYATAHQWYSALLAAQGRFDESHREALRAHELEPFSPTINSDVGRHLYFARRYEEALATHRRTLEMDRNFSRAYLEMGYVLTQMGQLNEAIAQFQQAINLDKDSLSALSGLGYAYGAAGKRFEAQGVLAELGRRSGQRYVSPYHLAVVYSGLGDLPQTLNHLEQATEERFNWLVFLWVEPQFDGLKNNTRFAALKKRVGLS
ncbi:MAG TPA: protein kinase [Pyrinomonadaceae bacterium]|nr:protein kinase [Pyrinomonadaceae bacterium]